MGSNTFIHTDHNTNSDRLSHSHSDSYTTDAFANPDALAKHYTIANAKSVTNCFSDRPAVMYRHPHPDLHT